MSRPDIRRLIRTMIQVNSVAIIILAATLFVYPPIRAAVDIRDPALRGPGIPRIAWRLYRSVTPRYARWAKERVAAGGAAGVRVEDVSGTEWPLFGSVFYLWASDNLQKAWAAGDRIAGVEPRLFGREAIVAASELVIDPAHATWVKQHWGPDYLHRENVFYRMLVMAALTSRANILHDNYNLDMLRDQVDTFAAELDATTSGLLDDYPGECYPGDVLAALMTIKRADDVLRTDHQAFVNRAVRGFTGTRLTRHRLPPYTATAVSGVPSSEARGCANSYMGLTAPELWPQQASRWYDLYDRFFWQERIFAVGYREYPHDITSFDWSTDVDAGPIVGGFGVAANAFGVGAARKNGRFDRAYPLATEMLATLGELPNGVLIVPRLLSNASNAPLLGEAGVLWQLTVQPEQGVTLTHEASVPPYVYTLPPLVLLFGLWRIVDAGRTLHTTFRAESPAVWMPRTQFGAWLCLAAGVSVAFAAGRPLVATAILIVAVMLPVTGVVRRTDPAARRDVTRAV